ncbi:MAG: riboflavin biosynthesis protein RibF [Planctomycetota bacterium]|nr:MAG: riboflavin biosynthesis protein RibF [Planctomycetota bacterium]
MTPRPAVLTVFDPRRLTPDTRGAVASIGVFDGVHIGHQATLAANVRRSRELGLVPSVVTFRRHPKRVLLGRAPRTLTSLEHRLELFARAGIEQCLALEFDEALREMPAEEFTRIHLIEGLRAREFVLGFDSKFGLDRRGGPELLRALGYPVHVVDEVRVAGRAVSSTVIREAVELGDLTAAAAMLGRPVSVLGRVIHGDARGRTIGFPTANLDLHHELHPPIGVYACRVWRLDRAGANGLAAVANIGLRPTVQRDAPALPTVEVHVLDFDADLYGERLEVAFVARLRNEMRFDGLDALRAQVERDVAIARTLLASS